MSVEDDLTEQADTIEHKQATENLRQVILERLMLLAGQQRNVRDYPSLLETFRFWKAGKKDPRRHGPPLKSERGDALSIEGLRAALVGFAMRRAGVPVDLDNRRALARTSGQLRKEWARIKPKKQGAAPEAARERLKGRRRPPADRFALAVLVARYTAPGSPGRKTPHAIATRMNEDGVYKMSLPKLADLISQILRPPKPE